MVRQCAVCGKTSLMAGKRKKLMSRYNPLPKKRKYPNLQWVKLSSSAKRVKTCTKCIKAMGKKK